MKRSLLLLLALSALLTLQACSVTGGDDDDATNGETQEVAVPNECNTLFEGPEFTLRRDQLDSLTDTSWPGYTPADASIVWTSEVETGHCVFLWHGGELRSVAVLSEAPSLGFGGYFGWMMPYEGTSLEQLVVQPDELRTWVLEAGADRAVVFPVESDLASMDQIRLPIHEAFHVDIQVDSWFGKGGRWMSWASLVAADQTETIACYEGGSTELAELVDGLDGDCSAAATYIALRDARRSARADAGWTVSIPTGGSLSCAEAERTWEAIEGLTDWASLGMLARAGLAEESDLSSYLLAINDKPFYRPALAKMIWMDRVGSDIEGILEEMLELDDAAYSVDWYFESEVSKRCN